jgi:thymidylate synthase
MRIYTNFREATNEIKRDLAEMGIDVKPHSYQNKNVEGNPEFYTKELQNYIYTVTQPKLNDLDATQPWAKLEFAERVSGNPVNPGEAYKSRSEVWNQFLNFDGEFDYTYPERLTCYGGHNQVELTINVLRNDPDSRQCYISIWDKDIIEAGGYSRIPCTLGYQFQIRNGALNITYLQRSSDFATHFQNDLYLAHKLQYHIADKLSIPVGLYTHWIGSLHIFQKDIKGVF